jgi:hypothetical protein
MVNPLAIRWAGVDLMWNTASDLVLSLCSTRNFAGLEHQDGKAHKADHERY